MSINYDDVKIGDKFFYLKSIGIYGFWGRGSLSYKKSFFIECEVLRTTKTQFTTESGRYRKSDGYRIGDDGYNLYKCGERDPWAKRTASKCEKIECLAYQKRLKVINDAGDFEWSHRSLKGLKNIEQAEKVAALIKEITQIIELGESK